MHGIAMRQSSNAPIEWHIEPGIGHTDAGVGRRDRLHTQRGGDTCTATMSPECTSTASAKTPCRFDLQCEKDMKKKKKETGRKKLFAQLEPQQMGTRNSENAGNAGNFGGCTLNCSTRCLRWLFRIGMSLTAWPGSFLCQNVLSSAALLAAPTRGWPHPVLQQAGQLYASCRMPASTAARTCIRSSTVARPYFHSTSSAARLSAAARPCVHCSSSQHPK